MHSPTDVERLENIERVRTAATPPRSRDRVWLPEPGVLALTIAVLSVGAAALGSSTGWNRSRMEHEIRGIALGMTPGDVRSRFRAPVDGRWRGVAAADPVLEWSEDPPRASVDARFEFHGGILVAVRVRVPTSDPDAHGPPIDVSSASVFARTALTGGREELTLLARDCPTHAAEVHRLIDGR